MAHHALGVAPPRAARARLVMRLGALHRREEARLVAAAVEYHTEAVIGRGLVRAELLEERVAPGGTRLQLNAPLCSRNGGCYSAKTKESVGFCPS
jgi:hypothetical protein